MAEQAGSHSAQNIGDPLPESLKHILVCDQCGSSIWRAATLDEASIVYHCVGCGAAMRINYDAATRTWTVVAE